MAEIIDANRFRERAVAHSRSGQDGGNMDDVLRRLGVVEAVVGELRSDVSAMKATIPHLATKADLSDLETRIIRWLVGTTLAAVSAAFAVAKFVN